MTTEQVKLKPCPLCGGDELSHGHSRPGVDGSAFTGEVQCHSCDLLIWKATEAEAIAAWNTRPNPPSPEAGERRELEQLLRDGWYQEGRDYPILSAAADAWIKRVTELGLRVLALSPAPDADTVMVTRGFAMPNGDTLTCEYPDSANWAKSWTSRDVQGRTATGEQDWEIVERYGLTAIANAMLAASQVKPDPPPAIPEGSQIEADVAIVREAVRLAEGYAGEVEKKQTSPAVYGQYVALQAIRLMRDATRPLPLPEPGEVQ